MLSSFGLIVLWPNFSFQKEIVRKNLVERFEILYESSFHWPPNASKRNFEIFYGDKLASSALKEKGLEGEGVVFLIKDNFPAEFIVPTSKGIEVVNKNLFITKTDLRRKLGTKFGIHGSNSSVEAVRDFRLLFGRSLYEFLNGSIESTHICVKEDLVVYDWPSLDVFFSYCNDISSYVVLGDVDPEMFDIDFLVEDRERFARHIGAKKCSSGFHRANYEILIEGKVVPIDIREVGDGYFDVCWQRDVLKSRVFGVEGFYVPSETHAFWTKVYHALIHRKKVPLKYQPMLSPLDEKKDGLYRFMMDFGYKMEEPSDVTLFFNSENGGSIKFTKERRWRQSKKLISKIKLRLFYLLSRLFRLKTRG